jgi:DNA-binding transcriptional MerR regulator
MGEALKIGQTAERTGMTVDAIRFYQKLGLVPGAHRATNGYRLFSENQVHDLKFIRHAQELGFSLSEIKDLLALRQEQHVCPKVQAMLAKKLNGVRDKIRGLRHLEQELKNALQNCNRALRRADQPLAGDCCPVLEQLEKVNGAEKINHGIRRSRKKR